MARGEGRMEKREMGQLADWHGEERLKQWQNRETSAAASTAQHERPRTTRGECLPVPLLLHSQKRT